MDDELMQRLINLTPTGSEFHNNPHRCLDHIESRLDTMRHLVKRNAQLKRQLRDVRETLRALVGCCLSGDEARLLMVGVNGASMSNPNDTNAQRLHERCDRISDALAAARNELTND
jgi:hypothetical protein